MRIGHVSAVAVLIAYATLSPPAQQFKSGTVGVRVDVLVTSGQQLVRGLQASDFELRDEGVLQALTQVDVEEIPLNLILVFDTSGSMAGQRMQALLEASRSLLDGLRERDRVALLSFSSRVRLLAPLTSSRQQIRGALAMLKPRGATSLRDAAFAGLALRQADPGRTLLLIFSDGADTASWLKPSAVLDSARRTDAVVYGIGIAVAQYSTTVLRSPNGAGTRHEVMWMVRDAGKFLKNLTEETGGRVLFANSNQDLRAMFIQTLSEFRERYVLSYSPSGVSPTGWHRLTVKLKTKAGTVTARRGYFAE
ncbi:MAG TPA: VWA domain-containing protein [Gemmatimonadaceae bacterium]|nr:VWA domain-containing protein [Gemmatimonadaceae bacterium]